MDKYSVKFFTETAFNALKEVLAWRHEYSPWEPKESIVLKPFQKEVVAQNQILFEQKPVVSNEIFCAGGKTVISAHAAVPFVKNGQKVLYVSPNRAAFPHFEYEFKRVLDSEGLDPELVHARNGTGGIAAFPVEKQVLIITPHDLVSPNAGPTERKVIDKTLRKTGLVIIDEVHRIPKDPQNDTVIIGKVEPIIREKAIVHGAKVLTMTGTHFREDAKAPFGIDIPDIQKTCQDLILEGCIAQLYGVLIIIDINVKNEEIEKRNDVVRLNIDRKRLLKYMDKIADVVIKVVQHENEFVKEVGANKPGGHAIFVSRQVEAISLCNILNKRLGRTAFVPYVSNRVSGSERQEVLKKLTDGSLLGYVTVMMGVESLNVPRLKYCHLVARITSGTKLMQAIGRVMRLPFFDDLDCSKIKDKAIVIDYQIRKKRIIRLAMGIRDIARVGGSKIDTKNICIGGQIFSGKNETEAKSIRSGSIRLGEYEAWFEKTNEGILSYAEVQALVRKLAIKRKEDYDKYYKISKGLPCSPHQVYKNKGWISWGDFLGKKCIKFCSYEEAKKIISTAVCIKTRNDYLKYYRKYNLPRHPNTYYMKDGFNWKDFLGILDKFVSYDEAVKIVRKAEVKSAYEYGRPERSKRAWVRPSNLPRSPDRTYKGNGWVSWDAFLRDGEKYSFIGTRFLSYEDALIKARRANIKTSQSYLKWKRREKIKDMPSMPYETYKNKGWISWAFFLRYPSYEDVLKQVKQAQLISKKSYRKWRKRENRKDMPPDPSKAYKGRGWVSWEAFFDYKSYEAPKFLDFDDACKFVRAKKLSVIKYRKWHKQFKPEGIPSYPDLVYKNKGWVSWCHFVRGYKWEESYA